MDGDEFGRVSPAEAGGMAESEVEAAAHGEPDRPAAARRTGLLIRHRTGTVTAAVAVVAFAAGAFGAFQWARPQPDDRIILRQATESDDMTAYTQVPGAGGILILLRNDSQYPVEVIDAAFSRTSAAPPLYIAPETVPPGGEVNLYVQTPAKCGESGLSTDREPPPVTISVSARLVDQQLQFVPVQVTGLLAQAIEACHEQGNI